MRGGGRGDVSAFGSEDGGTPRLAVTTATTPKRKFASFANAKQKGSPTGPIIPHPQGVAPPVQGGKLEHGLLGEMKEVDEYGRFLSFFNRF